MIYFDNAATSFPKPPCVIKELNKCLRSYCGNPGRSSHDLSLKASEKIYSAREEISGLLNLETPESIVFTQNATHALNLAIKSFVKEDCHVLTSDFEHNSVIRPLEKLKQTKGISYSIFNSDGNVEENILASINENTKGIICSIASNVTGKKIDLSLLSRITAERNLFLIIDASQAIGHSNIDLKKTPVDALCAPGHKALFGIQGSGFAYFKDKYRKDSLMEGGSGSESINPYMPLLLPEGYEAGTLSTPAIASLGRGVKYVKDIGIDEIEHKLNVLTFKLEERLYNLPKVKLYKSGNGILSFNVKDISSSSIASLLNDHEICVRGGLHCAPSIHKKLGTLNQGAVRLSFSYQNKFSEIDSFYKLLRAVIRDL